MVYLIENYDLSTYDPESEGIMTTNYIAGATGVNVQMIPDSSVVGLIKFKHVRRIDSGGDWIPCRAENGRDLIVHTVDDKQNADTLQGFSGEDYAILIIPNGVLAGTLSIGINHDGSLISIL